jgi:hypothetical protein
MGHRSNVDGTLFFKEALTDQQVAAFLAFRDGDKAPDGVRDWTLISDRDGLVCKWKDSLKADNTADGLRAILKFLKLLGVGWEYGYFRRSGDGDINPPDMEDWVVEEDSVEVEEQTPILIFGQEVFIDGFIELLRSRSDAAAKHAALIEGVLREHLKDWNEPDPDTAEAMDEDE